MEHDEDVQSPEYLVSGLDRAPGTVTVRRPVIALAALTAFGFLGLMLWIVVGRVSALAITPQSGTASQTVAADARPASLNDLGLSKSSKNLAAVPTPAPEASVSAEDLAGTAVMPPQQELPQAQPVAQVAQAAPMPQMPQMPMSMPQELSPERVAAMAKQQAALIARQAALGSDMKVSLDTTGAESRSGAASPQNTLRAAADMGAAPTSDYMLMRGMIIPATLATSVDSTISGIIVGMVSQDVYDSQHKAVVIPRGSRITGSFANGVAQGQRRLSASWDEIQLPNNKVIELGDMPGIDLSGTSGFGAAVDNHTRRAFTNVLLLSTLGAAAQLAQPQQSSSCGSSGGYCQPSVGSVVAGSVGNNLNNLGQQLLARDANIQPTLHISEGSQVAIMVVHSIPLEPYQ